MLTSNIIKKKNGCDFELLVQDIENKVFLKDVYNVKLSKIQEYQPLLNIGCIGNVSHGKSSLVHSITGKKTQKFKAEMERDITIKLGYANAKLYKNTVTKRFMFKNWDYVNNNPELELITHFSFIDAPGHESFMATMVSGTKSMHAAFLIIAANDPVLPQPQTFEHMAVISNTNIKEILILQNKTDLVNGEECIENMSKIKEFIKYSPYEESTIIPISAQLGINIEYIASYVSSNLNIPTIEFRKPAFLNIIRSFDINKPSIDIDLISGGVIGGTISQGIFYKGDYIEIRPGVIRQNNECISATPLIGKIETIFSEKTPLNFAISGGLIAFGTNIDPTFTKSNNLVGNIVGRVGTLPSIYKEIVVDYQKLNRHDKNSTKLSNNEKIVVSNNGLNIIGYITDKSKNKVKIKLNKPICLFKNDTVSIFKIESGKLKLAGWGQVLKRQEEVNIILPKEYNQYTDLPIPNTVIENDLQKNEVSNDIEIKKKVIDTGLEEKTEHLHPTPINYHENNSKFNFTYQEMTENLVLKGEKNKFKCKPPKAIYKNKVTYFLNFKQVIDSIIKNLLKNTTSYKELYIKYIAYELHAECNLTGDSQLLIKGRFGDKHLESILQSFIKTYIICYQCSGFKTEIIKENRLYFIKCSKCLSKKPVNLNL